MAMIRFAAPLAALALAACASHPAGAATAPPPSTFTIDGAMSLAAGNFSDSIDDTCTGKDGYDDMRAGTSVTVTDAGGTIVGMSQLGAGQVQDADLDGYPEACSLPFQVPGVPTGRRFYGVEVGTRGVVRYQEVQLRAPITLELG